MRGASALQTVLDQLPDVDTHVMVIWEPVIATDIAAPSTSVLHELTDGRVVQYWDRGLRLSGAILAAAREASSRSRVADELSNQGVVWDVVAVYPEGVRWEGTFPLPDEYAFPVIRGLDMVKRRLLGPAGQPR